MGCVAEDASLVKWLLDIGSDIHRWHSRIGEILVRFPTHLLLGSQSQAGTLSKKCEHHMPSFYSSMMNEWMNLQPVQMKDGATGTSFAATIRSASEETQKPTNMSTSL